MNHSEIAKTIHDRGFNCAQTVLGAFCEDFGLDPITAAKIAAGFGTGMGRTGGVCGALTGGSMVIGLKYCKLNADGSKYAPATELTYALVKELLLQFKQQNKSIICKELIGLDLGIPENLEYARKNIFSTQCSGYIQNVIEILGEILSQPETIPK
jgi:C_GCAxxG_C_C family probable redox protein